MSHIAIKINKQKRLVDLQDIKVQIEEFVFDEAKPFAGILVNKIDDVIGDAVIGSVTVLKSQSSDLINVVGHVSITVLHNNVLKTITMSSTYKVSSTGKVTKSTSYLLNGVKVKLSSLTYLLKGF